MASSATVRVDKATSDLLLGPDWTMNMEICDSINLDPGLAKDVVKALKKRLQHKSSTVQFFALTLLETMIKNCGDFVHLQVVERDILQEMVKIVRKKTDMEVRDKILVLLDSWQEAFGGSGGKYPQYFWAYTDLKRSGVDFPHRPSDATLIFTPPMHQAVMARTHVGHSDSPRRLDRALSSESANLSLSDLDRIKSVMELLNDMLKAVNSHDPEAVKDEVIKDLVDQCRSNQKKILQLIDLTSDEELLGEGLALNDNLQSLLEKHDAIASGSPFPEDASESNPVPSVPVAPPTIAANRFEEDEEEDDEFSQLARRNLISRPTYTETSDGTIYTNDTNVATAVKQSSIEVSSSMGSHPLGLPDPPPPIKTTTKEQNIIDLLSITLSSNTSPSHTPLTPSTPSTAFQPNGSTDPATINVQGHPKSPQNHPINQNYIPYRSYITPWAQTQPASLPQASPAQPQHQFHFQPAQKSHSQPQSHHPLQSESQQQPQYANYPPPPWEDAPSTNPNPFTQSTYLMQYNSFGMNAVNSPGETQANANSRPTGPAVSHKPFVPSYRLFEDLVDTSNPNGVLKASGSSGQGMAYGRK